MNQLECPICEFSFGWDTAGGLEVTCPCCAKSFSVTAEQLVVQSTPPMLPFPDPSNVKPAVVPTQDAPSEVTQQPLTTALVDLDDAGPRLKRFHHQRRRRQRRIWITLFLLLLSCGATGFLAYRMGFWDSTAQGGTDSPDGAGQTGDAAQADNDDVQTDGRPSSALDEQTKPDNSEVPADRAPEIDEAVADENLSQAATTAADDVPPPANIPQPKFLYTNRKTARLLWERVYPQLLLLEIESPAGRSTAVGVIVDSRGYVMTSLAAVRDAWSIKVTPARRQLADLSSDTELLSDQVRGILVAAPEHGLAILSVNRRFVISLSEINIPSQDKIVERKPLLRLVPPSPRTPWPYSETRIERKCLLAKLPQNDQLHIQKTHPKSGDHFWLRCPRSPLDLPGAPLFTEDGALVAILASSSTTDSFYVSTSAMAALKKSINGDAQPLAAKP